MHHVMIKNNGDFHFPSLLCPDSFLSTPAKTVHLLLYVLLLDLFPSAGNRGDVGR